MIWLTLRQFRVQAAFVFGGLAILVAALAATRPNLSSDYEDELMGCAAQDTCGLLNEQFFSDHQLYFGALVGIVLFLPGIIGVFWGAPLISRELENGTHRLAWNQSVTRTRWMAVKLGLIGLATAAAAGLAVAAVSWWSDPLDKALTDRMTRMTPLLFDVRGIAPIGYAVFAFMLGVTAGVLLRRLLPAMAVTLAVFIAVQFAIPLWVRPHLIPPETTSVAVTPENFKQLMINTPPGSTVGQMRVKVEVEPGSWTLSNETLNASGRTVQGLPVSQLGEACAPRLPGADETPEDSPPRPRVRLRSASTRSPSRATSSG